MKTVCIIPARGGSARIPRKNIKLFHGKPIIAYSIETALESRLFDDIYVSTDDPEIGDIAYAHGAKMYRRPEPDDGTKGTQEVAADVLRVVPAGLACVLYATAPMITPLDLWRGHQALSRAVFTYSSYLGDIGGFYWGPAFAFGRLPLAGNCHAVHIPPERAIDINTMDDWHRAETMFTACRRAS